MGREADNWLETYVQYASVTEAPRKMHFWAGVGALAGALRRKVWIDMKRFTWFPSFYIIFVAPPGVVAKSTTSDIAMNLLRSVPGIQFGPNSVTWQALVSAFADASESFEYPPGSGDWHPMSPVTLVASELGSLINMQDRDMINLLIELWDGKSKYNKVTKMSGNDTIECPWINLQGCTTPNWIAENMPSAAVGGGLSSRCIFIYAERKERFIAYVDEHVTDLDMEVEAALISDLNHIALNLTGPYLITKQAREWGRAWYEDFWTRATQEMDLSMVEGYAARKQTHMHKLALVLSASRSDDKVITRADLEAANAHLLELEPDMPKVFARVGQSEDARKAEEFVKFVQQRGKVTYAEAYRKVYGKFPDFRTYEGILNGASRSGQIGIMQDPTTGVFYLKAVGEKGKPESNENTHPNPAPPLPSVSSETSDPNS